MAANTAKDIKSMSAMVREEDLAELEDLRKDLQSRSDKAGENGQIYMMQQYIRLLAIVSPEIDRVQRRFARESLASLRKTHKDLKASRANEREG